jgi:hypothetical protein
VVPIRQCDAFNKEFCPEEKFLYAVAEKETGYNPRAIGPRGERSMYQMKYATWKRYTTRPFYCATTDPVLAHNIALRHLHYLLEYHFHGQVGIQANTVYMLALLWHYGEHGMEKRPEWGSDWVPVGPFNGPKIGTYSSDNEYGLAVKRLFLS